VVASFGNFGRLQKPKNATSREKQINSYLIFEFISIKRRGLNFKAIFFIGPDHNKKTVQILFLGDFLNILEQ
jgi:hypothetical protein